VERIELFQAEVRVFANAAELARAAAERFAEVAAERIRQAGRFTVALSGGSTPRALFALLAAEPCRSRIDWSRVHFFWGDERCVPPDHADSNYRMTRETLLSQVPVPAEHVFRMPAEMSDPDAAAAQYAAQLREVFGLPEGELPRFDLVFLGMGADGHTASLFPGTAALRAGEQIAVANYVEKFQAYRLTLTAATINQASEIIFLVAGADKAEPLTAVLTGPSQPELYPSQLIAPRNGKLIWMIDETAAARLREEATPGSEP